MCLNIVDQYNIINTVVASSSSVYGESESTYFSEAEHVESPICPPSPKPAPPSSFALAISRMVEMNADMEFAYARLMMLEHEHERVKVRLYVLEKLSEEGRTL